jgi:hypothetical protein
MNEYHRQILGQCESLSTDAVDADAAGMVGMIHHHHLLCSSHQRSKCSFYYSGGQLLGTPQFLGY